MIVGVTANESPKFKEQALALAESWLTLANIHNRFCSNPSYSGPVPAQKHILGETVHH
jgi:hypothetical protein